VTEVVLRRDWRRALGAFAFLGIAAALLLAPLIAGVLAHSSAQSDNRALAKWPGLPTTIAALFEWPRHVDSYAGDHFGLRAQMIKADSYIHWTVLGSSPVPAIVVGRNGRLFLSEGDTPFRDLLSNCGAWWSDEFLTETVKQIGASLRNLRKHLPAITILIVPTSAVLYPDDLPRWIERACAGRIPLGDYVLQHFPAEIRAGIYYPRDVAFALPPSTPLIPKLNFHWAGYGTRVFMEQFAQTNLDVKKIVSPSLEEKVEASDLSHFLPGVNLYTRLLVPDWHREVRYCGSPACLDTSPLDGIALPFETLRMERPGPGGRLLILSDSFGATAASTLIEYYSDIIDINLNNFSRLSRNDQRMLWTRVNTIWRPDYVLMVVQDGNVTAIPRMSDPISNIAVP
jgi:hypothetical protein